MGTVLEVTIEAASRAEARAAADALFALSGDLESRLSQWRPDSAMSRLNARAGQPPAPTDPVVTRMLRDAVEFTARTRGAFDVTVGPLVALWSDAGRAGRLPGAAAIAQARARVGAQHVRFGEGSRVGLARPGMAVDVGGLAKGWALDRMAGALAERGIRRAFVSFGQSSLLALGAPSDGPGWRVLVDDPAGGVAGVATLRDRRLSVSGSFGQWTEIEGRRLGHVIDPRSGWPVAAPAQAVVVAPTAAFAEALSKALLVLPPDEALALLEAEPGVEGLLVDADGARRSTSGFAAAAGFVPARAAPDGGAGAGS